MIHATAVVAEEAKLGKNVSVGPYSVIDGNVELGDNCTIGPHVHITGHTVIGSGTKVHKGAVIGDEPQDISFTGFTAYTNIGKDCVIREYVTVHRGSKPDASTSIGDNCMLMAFSHVAHDCQIKDHVVIANHSQIAGHVEINERAIISGGVFIHQFCKIGRMCMIGGTAKINQDVPPFCLVNHDSQIASLNAIGLKRNGVAAEERSTIVEAFKNILFGNKPRSQSVKEQVGKYEGCEAYDLFVNFIAESKRGIQDTIPRG
jgi:UDP-N-acetylglucosamine acyltransferase